MTKRVMMSDFIQKNMMHHLEYRRMAEKYNKSLLDYSMHPGAEQTITFVYKREDGSWGNDYVKFETDEHGIFLS